MPSSRKEVKYIIHGIAGKHIDTCRDGMDREYWAMRKQVLWPHEVDPVFGSYSPDKLETQES